MKNIKDITISIFAIIGFVAIVTGFTNEAEQQTTFGTPESHVWAYGNDTGDSYLYNKVTGEIRFLTGARTSTSGTPKRGLYDTLKEGN